MVLLELDPFLTQLARMFERAKGGGGGGTVWVTMKRTNLKPRKGKVQPDDYLCLIRAVSSEGGPAADGKKKKKKSKLSAVVNAKEYARFQASYATILKAHMDALKKKERRRK